MTGIRRQAEGEGSPGGDGGIRRNGRSVWAGFCSDQLAMPKPAEKLQEERTLKEEGDNLLELKSRRSKARQSLDRYSPRVQALLGWLQ